MAITYSIIPQHLNNCVTIIAPTPETANVTPENSPIMSRSQHRGLFIMKRVLLDTSYRAVGILVTKKAAIKRLSLIRPQRRPAAVEADFSVNRATMEQIRIQSKDKTEKHEDLSDDEGHSGRDSAVDTWSSLLPSVSFGKKIKA